MSISSNPTISTTAAVKSGTSTATKTAETEESRKSERAQDAIKKFEGLFMSMMIKQLRETSLGEGFFPGDSSDTYGGMFDTFMGDHLAESSNTGLENLFNSKAAMRQLEEYVKPKMTFERQSKGIEEYRNEQFRSGAITSPAAS